MDYGKAPSKRELMPLDTTEIAIAVIGGAATVATAYLTNRKARHQKTKRVQAENEMRFQAAALDFAMFLDTWGDIVEQVKIMFDETELERFIIFRAFNGKHHPKWTTGVLQMRDAGQHPVSYVHYELDDDYKNRLSLIGSSGYARVIVKDLKDCGIKEIYEAEGVTDSFWAFIDRRESKDGMSHAITYCSFATTQESGLSEATITRCKVITGRLKGAAQAFQN